MKTISAKFERADKRRKLKGLWFIEWVTPLMSCTVAIDGLKPGDVVFYRNRTARVVRVDKFDVTLDRPLAYSWQAYCRPSVYRFSEVPKV